MKINWFTSLSIYSRTIILPYLKIRRCDSFGLHRSYSRKRTLSMEIFSFRRLPFWRFFDDSCGISFDWRMSTWIIAVNSELFEIFQLHQLTPPTKRRFLRWWMIPMALLIGEYLLCTILLQQFLQFDVHSYTKQNRPKMKKTKDLDKKPLIRSSMQDLSIDMQGSKRLWRFSLRV